MQRDLDILVDQFFTQENIYRFEGRAGLEALCRLAAALGYKDPMYWGQITSKATIGDLICMLEDNSGMIEAMIEWVKDINAPAWRESLEEQLEMEFEEEEE